MKTIKLNVFIVTALVVFITTSFTDKSTPASIVWGVYGICNNNESESKIELIINEDHTFRYFDNIYPNKIIDIKGKWTANGNTLYLTDYNSDLMIQNKWSLDNNEKCLRSRKGLEWTRLCHIGEIGAK